MNSKLISLVKMVEKQQKVADEIDKAYNELFGENSPECLQTSPANIVFKLNKNGGITKYGKEMLDEMFFTKKPWMDIVENCDTYDIVEGSAMESEVTKEIIKHLFNENKKRIKLKKFFYGYMVKDGDKMNSTFEEVLGCYMAALYMLSSVTEDKLKEFNRTLNDIDATFEDFWKEFGKYFYCLG